MSLIFYQKNLLCLFRLKEKERKWDSLIFINTVNIVD